MPPCENSPIPTLFFGQDLLIKGIWNVHWLGSWDSCHYMCVSSSKNSVFLIKDVLANIWLSGYTSWSSRMWVRNLCLKCSHSRGNSKSTLFWNNWHRHIFQQQRELILSCSRSLPPRSHNRCFVTHQLNRSQRGQLFFAIQALKVNQFWKREPEILQQGRTAATLMSKQQIKSNVFCILTDINMNPEETHVWQPWN